MLKPLITGKSSEKRKKQLTENQMNTKISLKVAVHI